MGPGDTLESAVLLSVKQEDEAAFERNFLQLRTYYTDAK
jgi:26S proteasome regulatory subunit N12